MQSKKDLNADKSFNVYIGIMKYEERGGGGYAKKITNIGSTDEENTIRQKRSMVFIPEVEVCKFIITCLGRPSHVRPPFM